MPENRYAVLIGCNNYPQGGKKLPPLRCAETDVKGVQDALIDKNIGGFNPNNVYSMTNKPHNEILLQINKCFQDAGRDDLVFLYFSGHGRLDQGNKLHLATVNTNPDLLQATSIPMTMIKDFIDRSPAQKLICILDCCYSGAAGNLFKGGDVDSELKIVSGGTGTYIMTASTGVQVAEEKEGEDYSLFTKHFLEGLVNGQADLNGDGEITVEELYDYVHEKVKQSGKQEPMKFASGVVGSLVIAAAKQPQRLMTKCLTDLLTQKHVSTEEYSFAVGIVTSKDPLPDNLKSLVKLVEEVTEGAEPAGLIAFIKQLKAIEIEGTKKALREVAKSLHEKGLLEDALKKWKEVLNIDSGDPEAGRQTDELGKVIQRQNEIGALQSSAERYSKEGKDLDAIVEWVEVLRKGAESEMPLNKIRKILETIKGKSA